MTTNNSNSDSNGSDRNSRNGGGGNSGGEGARSVSGGGGARPLNMAALETGGITRAGRAGRDVALVSGFAALIATCSLLPAVSLGPVPITMQTFAVLLAGAALGARRGFYANVLYLAVGAIGVPVFAGGAAGFAPFAGPTVGYLVGFPLGAFVVGLLVKRLPRFRVRRMFRGADGANGVVPGSGLGSGRVRVHGVAGSFVVFVFAGFAGAVVIHVLGILGLVWRLGVDFAAAAVIDVVFVPGDLVKIVLTAMVATAVVRAFPVLAR